MSAAPSGKGEHLLGLGHVPEVVDAEVREGLADAIGKGARDHHPALIDPALIDLNEAQASPSWLA